MIQRTSSSSHFLYAPLTSCLNRFSLAFFSCGLSGRFRGSTVSACALGAFAGLAAGSSEDFAESCVSESVLAAAASDLEAVDWSAAFAPLLSEDVDLSSCA